MNMDTCNVMGANLIGHLLHVDHAICLPSTVIPVSYEEDGKMKTDEITVYGFGSGEEGEGEGEGEREGDCIVVSSISHLQEDEDTHDFTEVLSCVHTIAEGMEHQNELINQISYYHNEMEGLFYANRDACDALLQENPENEDYKNCMQQLKEYQQRIRRDVEQLPTSEDSITKIKALMDECKGICSVLEMNQWVEEGGEMWYGKKRKNQWEGKVEMYDMSRSKKRREGVYHNNEKNGRFTSYYENGNKEWEGDYEGNVLNGYYVEYLENGKEHSRALYRNDAIDGIRSVNNANENVRVILAYSDGLCYLRKEYYENGNLRLMAIPMIDGDRKVFMMEYDEEGWLLYRGEGKQSEREGSVLYEKEGEGTLYYQCQFYLKGEFTNNQLFVDMKRYSIEAVFGVIREGEKNTFFIDRTGIGNLIPWKKTILWQSGDKSTWFVKVDGRKHVIQTKQRMEDGRWRIDRYGLFHSLQSSCIYDEEMILCSSTDYYSELPLSLDRALLDGITMMSFNQTTEIVRRINNYVGEKAICMERRTNQGSIIMEPPICE